MGCRAYSQSQQIDIEMLLRSVLQRKRREDDIYPTWNTYTHLFAAGVYAAKRFMTFMALIDFCIGYTVAAFLYPSMFPSLLLQTYAICSFRSTRHIHFSGWHIAKAAPMPPFAVGITAVSLSYCSSKCIRGREDFASWEAWR